jgi:hypothetical protein
MNATCDDLMNVYFDGEEQPSPLTNDQYLNPTTFDVPSGTQVVGISCQDIHGQAAAGIVASFSNGLVTDDRWYCSGTPSEGWENPDFGPTSPAWVPATKRQVRANNPAPISPDADWIWTPNGNIDEFAYCRKVIEWQAGKFFKVILLIADNRKSCKW